MKQTTMTILAILVCILVMVNMVAAVEEKKRPTNKGKSKYDHFVVIMYENRSFDHMLGYVSDKWNGVIGKNISNPIPEAYQKDGKTSVPTATTTEMKQPMPDPSHGFAYVNTQVFSSIHPKENEHDPKHPKTPFNRPEAGEQCNMKGFVHDYILDYYGQHKSYPNYDTYSQIMNSFEPEAIPVMSTIAKGFNVADNYFCAVPSKTEPNRLFFAAAESDGYVMNHPMNAFLNFTGKTMFEVLEENNISWKIYYDAEQVLSVTYLLLFAKLEKFWSKTAYMAQFYRDAKEGNLPQFAFIEPMLTYNYNDMHPAHFSFGGHSSVMTGEVLLHNIYEAIRTSESPTGSNYTNTLFMTTYDEHGGIHDHVCPPKTQPPVPKHNPGEMGFNFDRLGVRVPSIFVSAYTDEHSVTSTQLQHTSVIRTIFDRFGITETLNDRDANAPLIPMDKVQSRDSPREPKDWPKTNPRKPTAKNREREPLPNYEDNFKVPMDDEQHSFYHMALSSLYHLKHPLLDKYVTLKEKHDQTVKAGGKPILLVGHLVQIFSELRKTLETKYN